MPITEISFKILMWTSSNRTSRIISDTTKKTWKYLEDSKKSSIFASRNSKAIMEVAINNNIYQEAQAYAQQQGLSLPTVIENFLLRFIGKNKAISESTVPDIVLSLLGAAEPVADNDLNAREAYYQYLEEKYR